MTPEQRVKLRGVLAQTASSATIDAHGNLVIELYDFSAAAHTWLGNDVAFVAILDPAAKREALARLVADHPPHANDVDGDALLLRLVQDRFSDYYAVEQWLDEQHIPYGKEFEPWA